MKPFYWRKAEFERLGAFADTLRDDPLLSMLAEYCELLEKGLRKQAIAVSRQFVKSTEDWAESDRRVATGKLMAEHFGSPHRGVLVNHPILRGLVTPTLERWVQEEPDNPIALRWYGRLMNNFVMLQKAIAISPGDNLVRRWLADWLLGDADYAMHHLSESLFLGDEKQAGDSLEQAHTLLLGADAPELFTDLLQEHEELSRLLQDWLDYKRNPTGSFPDWCDSHGKQHKFWRAIYYKTK